MKSYSEVRIESGIKLAQQWYEGWKLDALDPGQLLEAIEKAGEHGPLCDCQTCADAGEGKWGPRPKRTCLECAGEKGKWVDRKDPLHSEYPNGDDDEFQECRECKGRGVTP